MAWPGFGEEEREVVTCHDKAGRELQIFRCEEDETLQDVYDGKVNSDGRFSSSLGHVNYMSAV